MKGGEVAPEKAAGEVEAVAIELTAPAGWTKKFTLSEDGTPRKNEIVFISPTGEEIKSKRQLQQYLKAHPGSPPSSEFNWRTGDTPRRSARIREKAKAVETPEDEKPKKRERKSSSKKEAKERDSEGNEASPAKEEGAVAEAKEDVTMQEVAVPADFQTKVGDDANEVIDEVTVDVETKVVDSAYKVERNSEGNEASPAKEEAAVAEAKEDVTMQEVVVPADFQTKVGDDANEVIDEVTVDVETKVVDGAYKVERNSEGNEASPAKEEAAVAEAKEDVTMQEVVVPADFQTKVGDDANEVIDEVTVDVETKVVDGAYKVERNSEGNEASPAKEEASVAEAKEDVMMQEVAVPADFQTKVGDDANEVIDEVTVDVETKVVDGAYKVIDEVPVDVETKVDGDANKVKDEVCADVETKVDGDANKAIAEAVAAEESPNEKKDSVLESNASAKNKTEAFSENQKEATPEVVPTPVAEKHDGEFSTGNGQQKEDAEAAELSEAPSTSCGEAQHLPKASPVNC